MINKKKQSFVLICLIVFILFIFTGCKLQTTIISDAESPKVMLEQFFAELKEKNYSACDTYLADNATFVIDNDTGYDFMNDLIELEIDKLSYKLIGETSFDGVNASQQVKITALNVDKLTKNMKENMAKIEYEYLVDKHKSDFDKENNDDVSDVMRVAMEKYADNAGTVENTVTVKFKFQNNTWKIKVDSDFTAAIFGGSIDEQ